jgi:hypothetical protein
VKTVVFDAGAFIALEHGSTPVRSYVLLADRGDVVDGHVAVIALDRRTSLVWGVPAANIVRC